VTTPACPVAPGLQNFHFSFGQLPRTVIAGGYTLEVNAVDSDGLKVACLMGSIDVPRGKQGQIFRTLDGHEAADCVMIEGGAQSTGAGVFVPGSKGAWGTAVEVDKRGETAPQGGLWCLGCVLVQQGDGPAPAAGSFWESPDADVQMVEEGATAQANGIWCQGGNGKLDWVHHSSPSSSWRSGSCIFLVMLCLSIITY